MKNKDLSVLSTISYVGGYLGGLASRLRLLPGANTDCMAKELDHLVKLLKSLSNRIIESDD